MRMISAALATALLAAGAAHAEDLVASARPTIARADADWIGAMQAKDAERLAEPYADDGVFVTPDGTAITGRAAIADFYRRRLAASKTKIVGGGVRYDRIVVGGTASAPLSMSGVAAGRPCSAPTASRSRAREPI